MSRPGYTVSEKIPDQMYPPGRGIWWPREVLDKVILTFLDCQMTCTHQMSIPGYTMSEKFQIRCTLLVVAAGGHEEYYIRSS